MVGSRQYYLLLLATVVQYYCTEGSSLGYLANLINQEYDFEANGRLVTDDSVSGKLVAEARQSVHALVAPPPHHHHQKVQEQMVMVHKLHKLVHCLGSLLM
jgi:hypothetical protein